MSHAELERYLFLIGPLEAHANAFLAWLSLGREGTIVTAGHVVNGRESVMQPTTGISVDVDFHNPAVRGKDLAFSRRKSPEAGLEIAPRIDLDERLYITGYYQQKPFVIPVKAHDVRGGKLIVTPDTIGLARPGMSGSALVNEQRQVVGVLVRQGHTPHELVAELLRDIR